MPVPCNRGPQISMIGAISLRGVEAALYGEWATNGEIFLEFVAQCLAPKLRPGMIVIMDNVRFHLQANVIAHIESRGAKVVFLPPILTGFLSDRKHVVKNKKYAPSVDAKNAPSVQKIYQSSI